MKPTLKNIYKYPLHILPAILLIAVLSQNASAAEGVKVVTLEQAIKIADEHNRDIQKAKEYISWTEGKYVEERASALPQFLISGNLGRGHDASQLVFNPEYPYAIDQKTASVTMTQALFTWGQVGAAIRAAKEGKGFAAEQLRQYRQTVQKEVTVAFYDILLARELLELANQNLRQKEKHLDESRKKFASGVATDYDVLAAEVAMKNAKPDKIRTENLLKTTKERLRFLLVMEKESVDAEGKLDIFIKQPPSFEEALSIANANRPDLKSFDNRISMSKELVKVANSLDKPRLDMRGQYGWAYMAPSNIRPVEGQLWSLGVQLNFPIFDGLRTRGKVAQSKSDVRSLEIEKGKMIDTISLQIRDATNSVVEAEEIVKALGDNVKQAERLLSMAEKGFSLGVKTRLEVDDAEINLLQAKGNLSKAKRDYLSAYTNLDWIMGIIGEAKKI